MPSGQGGGIGGRRAGPRGPAGWCTAVLAVALSLAGCMPGEPAADETPPVLVTAELEAAAGEAVENGAPGLVFHVRNGDQVVAKAAGTRNLDSGEPAEPGDKLWISGAGAPMVAVAVLKLAENGALGLDDPAAKYLPEFAAIFPAWERTTIRELLGSRTGLPDYIPALLESKDAEALRTTALTFEERLRIAATAGGARGPLSQPAWSATDWEVLAWLVERTHGRPLAEVLQSEVFEPAGMASSLLATPGAPPEPILHGYVLSGGSRLDFTRADAAAASGDAGIISTVEDLNRFFAALPAGQLVNAETWEAMVHGDPYDLGGLQWTGAICPGQRHVFIYGGGGAYNVQSVSSLDGRQQVSVGMALPPAELGTPGITPLVERMQEAVEATAKSMCR